MIEYSLRQATAADSDFLWSLVAKNWGWTEARHHQVFLERFHYSKVQVIELGDVPIGALSVERQAKTHVLANILIFPEFQNRGIGSRVIRDVQAESAKAMLPVTLSVFKASPAANLYRGLGFEIIQEDELRYYMKWGPASTPLSSFE
jgi:ribosomal protein S18 acetylase RimI-like enzyme